MMTMAVPKNALFLLGICKIFGCALEKLFVMKVFNEESNSTRFQVVKCQPSVDGDYLGIVLEGELFNIYISHQISHCFKLPAHCLWANP